MKKIAIILLAILFVGCTKDEPICWICDISVGGSGPGITEICNDSEHAPQEWSDGQGNTWGNFECTKK